MKYIKLFLVLLVFGISFNASAQYKNFEGTVHLGIPTGELDNFVNLVYGLDMTYYFSHDNAGVLDLGFTGGYTNFNADRRGGLIDAFDASFLKVGAAGKLNFQNDIFFNTDLGYAFGLDQVDGGLYFSPKIGYHFDSFVAHIYYTFIRSSSSGVNDLDYASIGVGFGIRL